MLLAHRQKARNPLGLDAGSRDVVERVHLCADESHPLQPRKETDGVRQGHGKGKEAFWGPKVRAASVIHFLAGSGSRPHDKIWQQGVGQC